MEKKLSVNNLVISFRTPGGKVQAVRNISFDLNKGETLAIVGESGSGKSVTSKAILGILAGNSIIEGGSILYDGMDLLKITEDEFYHIRGDRIAMIFQDPLSSLNPIMRIGKQLTEAMLLKGKARQKASKKNFNETLKRLETAMLEAKPEGFTEEELKKLCADFDKFEMVAIKLEKDYDAAHESAVEALDEVKDVLFHIEKKAFTDQKYTVKEIIRLSLGSVNDYVVSGDDAESLKTLTAELKSVSGAEIKKNAEYEKTVEILKKLEGIFDRALAKDAPDFFDMGYFFTFDDARNMPDKPMAELNAYLKQYTDEHFMNRFRAAVESALKYSADKYQEKKGEALKVIAENRAVFDEENLDKAKCNAAAEVMIKAVEASIDPLEIHKDGLAYTFRSSLKGNIETYFEGIIKNEKAAKEHGKQQKKYDKEVARGKNPTWKVVPEAAVDLGVIKETICHVVDRLTEHYEEREEIAKTRNFVEEADSLLETFKENASGVVAKVTKSMAKYKALKLMEEVGISDVRKRYKQYPFEFSGGMRQRIVIAIALAADPDILICDEPTTALDVTIQAQILELINRIKKDRNLSIIFITHDLGVVANMADRIAVMYAGKIVETGTSEDVFYSPAHPYTWALLSAMPDTETNERLLAIPGTPPNMIYPPEGDAFAERNQYALKIDFKRQPPMFKISDTHYAATWLLHPDAPKVEPPKIITDRIERMKRKRGEANG